MSAISGLLHRDSRPIDADLSATLVTATAVSGPDGSDIINQGNVALAFHQLAVSSVPRSGLVASEDGSLLICFDGRIDNRGSLPQTQKGTFPVDAVLVLNAYQKWGHDCAARLVGDFAFAIWDASLRQIYCARDHMGVRPFNYFLDNRTFAFSSALQGLRGLIDAQLSVNPTRIADYLLGFEYADFDTTFYREVKRLPPAHYLIVASDKVQITRYWSLDPGESTGDKGSEHYRNTFLELLDEAVDCRLADVDKPASMLSGGLDSAAVTSRALRVRPDLAIFSAVSKDAFACGDSMAVKTFTEARRVSPHTSTVDAVKNILGVAEQLDDPFAAIQSLALVLYRQARSSGYTVMLDGVEGDLVMSLPSDYPAVLMRQGLYSSALNSVLERSGHFGSNPMMELLGTMRSAFSPYVLRRFITRSRFPATFGRLAEGSIISESLLREPGLRDRYASLLTPDRSARDSLFSLQASWLEKPYIAVALERYNNAAAASGIEVRHPLLDKRLLEYCVALPLNQKVRGGWSKWLLREALDHELPGELAWRKDKPHLGGSFTLGLYGLMEDRIRMHLGDVSLNSEFISPSKLRRLLNLNDPGPLEQEQLWMTYCLSCWLQANR